MKNCKASRVQQREQRRIGSPLGTKAREISARQLIHPGYSYALADRYFGPNFQVALEFKSSAPWPRSGSHLCAPSINLMVPAGAQVRMCFSSKLCKINNNLRAENWSTYCIHFCVRNDVMWELQNFCFELR